MGRGWRPLDGLMRGNSVILRTAVDAESAPPAPRPSSSGPCTRLSCAVYAFGPRGAVGTHVGASRLELSPRAPGRWSLVAGFLASGALERARGEKTTGSGSRDFWTRRHRAEPNLPLPPPPPQSSDIAAHSTHLAHTPFSSSILQVRCTAPSHARVRFAVRRPRLPLRRRRRSPPEGRARGLSTTGVSSTL